MKARSIVLLLFILIAQISFAQKSTFKVLAAKGKTEIKSANAWQTLKVGASLSATDEIKIAENSYLGLMHESGKPLELKQAGSHKVSDLVQRAGSGKSVVMKYTDFILSSNQEKKNRLTATGAVHRGVNDPIVLILPEKGKSDLYGDKIGLQWTTDAAGPYEVVVTNFMDEELARLETNSKELVLAVNEGKLATERNILVKITSKGKHAKASQSCAIKKLQGTDREKYAQSVTEFSSSLEPGSALSQYVLAGFYEEQFLLNDALTAYQEAMKLAPEVDMYKEAYADFVARLGFKLK